MIFKQCLLHVLGSKPTTEENHNISQLHLVSDVNADLYNSWQCLQKMIQPWNKFAKNYMFCLCSKYNKQS